MDLSRRRFEDAGWFETVKSLEVAVLGAGGVGSHLSFMLTRMGVGDLFLFDSDKFTPENLAGQLITVNRAYNEEFKTHAVKSLCDDFSLNTNITTINNWFDDYDINVDVIFSCVDSMQGRKNAFDKFLSSDCKVFIDARLNAEFMQVFFIDKEKQEHVELYKTTQLFSDEEVEDAVCTFKQTTHFASMVSSFMTSCFASWCHNQNLISKKRRPMRKIPFKTEFNGFNFSYDCIW